MYNFDKLIDRKNTGAMKMELPKYMHNKVTEDTKMFWVADMDFSCAPEILNALRERVNKKILGYTIQSPTYYETVNSWYETFHNLSFEKEDMFYSPGVIPALQYLVQLLTKEGDGIIIQSPVYSQFYNLIGGLKRRVVLNPLKQGADGFSMMDFKDFEEKARDNKVVIISNPHNPCGRVWSCEELKEFCSICEKHQVKIISDEIHGELVRTGNRYIPTSVAYPQYEKNVITCLSPSKTFNLAGMQDAIVIMKNETLKEEWKDLVQRKNGLVFQNVFSMVATEAAYSKGIEWLQELKVYLDENFQYIKTFIEEKLPKVGFYIPEGTYFAWLDFRAYKMTDEKLEEKLITEGGIFLEQGNLFGQEGSGFMRMNIACPRAFLVQGLEGIQKAFSNI